MSRHDSTHSAAATAASALWITAATLSVRRGPQEAQVLLVGAAVALTLAVVHAERLDARRRLMNVAFWAGHDAGRIADDPDTD
jgi:hypothetical protein